MNKINRRDFLKISGVIATSAMGFPYVIFSKEKDKTNNIIGPYIQNIKENRATICWLDKGKNKLHFSGKKNSLEKEINNYVLHKTTIENLKPGRAYEYSVGDKQRKFKTKPIEFEPFSFLVYGDTQNPYLRKRILTIQKNIIKLMKESTIEEREDCRLPFFIHTGDMTEDGRDFKRYTNFFNIIEPLSGQIELKPTKGNHEYYYPPRKNYNKKNIKYFLDFFGKDKEFYISEWGNCRFIHLDSTSIILGYYHKEQIDLLNSIKDDKTNILSLHHPLVGPGKNKRGYCAKLNKFFRGRLKNINIILAGHEHYYRRNKIKGKIHIIGGGGGSHFLNKTPNMSNLKYARRFHFQKVDVEKNKLSFKVIGDRGDLIDSFSYFFD